ncbi:hypothetical protein [Beggiatoa leptomitoformis]|uniref:Uncharacterized protein n=1 Tax=Beggiatoa leptomitoformis TaxID=288004 RepID=A0A2N9YBD7_9GAMM|nr:hypothetical protein [Beggiatoa leptomitoformis]ALG66887.1 hypothetical protein AL038_03100 [Beggiatoa leptomitoformis]AUI67754.1 hypothetical protein BLE401_02940 [Beggiatoa leptomitoformis]
MAKFTTVLIPADHYFIPSQEAIMAAKLLMEKYFPDRGDDVKSCTWEKPFFIEGRDAFEEMICPACGETVNRFELESFESASEEENDDDWDEEWWYVFLEKLSESDNPIATQILMPCCNQAVVAENIRFPYDAGFARFKLWLPDPGDSMNVTNEQLANLETTLGCKLIHISEVNS